MRLWDQDRGYRVRLAACLFFVVALSLIAPSLAKAVTVSGRVTKCGAAVGYTVKAYVNARVGVEDDLGSELRTPGGSSCVKALSSLLRGTTTTNSSGNYSINVNVSAPPGTCSYEYLGITVKVYAPGGSTLLATSPLSSPMNFSLSCPPPPRFVCPDGRIAPTTNPDYRIGGRAELCSDSFRSVLALEVSQIYVNTPERPFVTRTVLEDEALAESGEISLAFNWCRDVAPRLPEERPLFYTIISSVFVEIHDTVTDRVVHREMLSLLQNAHTVDVSLLDTPSCGDRVLATELYVTQAVKANEHTPMITGRTTIARLFASPSRASVGDLRDVPALLHGSRDGSPLPGSPLSPFGADTIDIDLADSLRDQEYDASKSWNFYLPLAWVSEDGEIELEAEIDPANTLGECTFCDFNNRRFATVEFTRGRRLDLQPYRVIHQASGEVTEPQVVETLRLIIDTYPYQEINIRPIRVLVASGDQYMSRILGRVQQLACPSGDCGNVYHIAIVNPTNLPIDPNYGEPLGLGLIGFPAAVSAPIPRTAAQELGHNFGRLHAWDPFGLEDRSYPYEEGSIGRVGFDTRLMVAKRPDETRDFMSALGLNSWISDYTWRALHDTGLSGPPTTTISGPPLPEEPRIRLRGTLAEGAMSWKAAYVFDAQPIVAAALDQEAEIDWEVRVLDSSGSVLSSRRVEWMEVGLTDSVKYLDLVLSFPSGAARLAVVDLADASVVFEDNVIGAAPSVELLSAEEIEKPDGSRTLSVSWEASDSDGDALSYWVQYSDDGGDSWATLAMDLTETELDIPAPEPGDTEPGRVRVLASDGIQTAQSEMAVGGVPTGLARRVPGDCNQDGSVNIADTSCVLGVLFLGSPAEFPCGDGTSVDPGNIALLDWQGDGNVNIADASAIVQFVFLGGNRHVNAHPLQPTRGCVALPGCSAGPACDS